MEKIMLCHIPKAIQWLLSECINPPLLHKLEVMLVISFLSYPAVILLHVFFWSHVNRLQIIQIWGSRSWTVCQAWHVLSECNKRQWRFRLITADAEAHESNKPLIVSTNFAVIHIWVYQHYTFINISLGDNGHPCASPLTYFTNTNIFNGFLVSYGLFTSVYSWN